MKLSVIVTAYNAASSLKCCLDSLVDQNLADYEIVVVNDGSHDETKVIMDDYQSQYPYLFKMIHQANMGVSGARNSGFDAAEGEYITYVDSDDHVYQDAYRKIIELAIQHDSDLVVYDANYEYLDGNTSPFVMSEAAEGFLTRQQFYLVPPCPWNKIMRKHLFIEANLRFEVGMIYEDYALIPNLAQKANSIYYHKEAMIAYVQSDNSIMRSSGYKKNATDILKASEILFQHCDQSQFKNEVEFVVYDSLLQNSSRYFLMHEKFEELKQVADFMRKHFPDFMKNPYIKQRPRKERLIARLFVNKQTKLLALLVGTKRKIRSEKNA